MEGPKGRKQQMTVSNDGAVSSWSFNMNEVDNSENEQLQLAVESQFEELECDDAEDAGSIDSDFILIMDLKKLILTHLIIVRHKHLLAQLHLIFFKVLMTNLFSLQDQQLHFHQHFIVVRKDPLTHLGIPTFNGWNTLWNTIEHFALHAGILLLVVLSQKLVALKMVLVTGNMH